MTQILLSFAFILEVVMLLLGGYLIYLGDWKRRNRRYNTSWQYNIVLGIILVAGAARAIISTINYL